MIARCDSCDRGSWGGTGHRYDPALGAVKHWRCQHCGGELRPKRNGEREASVVSAVFLDPLYLTLREAYQAGFDKGRSRRGQPFPRYVPTHWDSPQMRAEYLQGVREGWAP